MTGENTTIFTTTLGTKLNIKRQEEFLQRQGFRGEYLVIDANNNQELKSHLKGKFTEYIHAPKVSCGKAFTMAGEIAKKKYILFLGDDDFPVLNGVAEAENVLSRKDINGCYGKSAWFNYRLFNSQGKQENIVDAMKILLAHKVNIQPRIAEGRTIDERIEDFGNNFRVMQFAIIKKWAWRKVFSEAYYQINDIHSEEIASSLAIATLLRLKELNSYTFIRGTGHTRPNTQKDTAEQRNKIDDQKRLMASITEYFRDITGNDHDADQAAQKAMELRIKSINGTIKQPASPKNKDDLINFISKRGYDLFSDRGLLDAIAALMTLATQEK